LRVKLCDPCLDHLIRGQAPRAGLNFIDPGVRPAHLRPLSYLESLCISPLRPLRQTVVCYPSRREAWMDPHNYTRALRAHVIAHSNPLLEDWQRTIPRPLDALPEVLQVVLLAPASSEEQVKQMLQRTRALQLDLPSLPGRAGSDTPISKTALISSHLSSTMRICLPVWNWYMSNTVAAYPALWRRVRSSVSRRSKQLV
jgi:hypothetical protein